MSKVFCPNCYHEFETEPAYCLCGYPFRDEMERNKFMEAAGKKEKIIQEGITNAERSRNILFFVGGLSMAFSLIFMFITEDNTYNILTIMYSGVLIGLGFYSYKEPFFALLIGFLVLLAIYAITAMIDPAQLLGGLIVRIIVVGSFIFGLVKIKRSEKVRKEI